VTLLRFESKLIRRSKAVAFQITFVQDPEAQFVCEVIKSRIINLMTCPNCVDVVCLHNQKISSEELIRNGSSMVWMMLMTVDAAKFNRLAIHKEDSILQFRVTEAHSLLDCTVLRGEN
jgi:hypothetical protein